MKETENWCYVSSTSKFFYPKEGEEKEIAKDAQAFIDECKDKYGRDIKVEYYEVKGMGKPVLEAKVLIKGP